MFTQLFPNYTDVKEKLSAAIYEALVLQPKNWPQKKNTIIPASPRLP